MSVLGPSRVAGSSPIGTLTSTGPSQASAAEEQAVSNSTLSHLSIVLARIEELWDVEEDESQARAERRSKKGEKFQKQEQPSLTQACSRCRAVKTRCYSTETGDPCSRCAALKVNCVYPEKRMRGPKKRLSKTQKILDDARRHLHAAMKGGGYPAAPLTEDDQELSDQEGSSGGLEMEPVRGSPGTDLSKSPGETGIDAILRNPLATLAHHATNRINTGPSFAQTYYEDGLYQCRPEYDFSVDPVNLGILSHSDLERLVNIYFQHLRPFLWHLDPQIHTAAFLRENSPFLTSALAAAAASFDPLSAHFAFEISVHARSLANRAFADGLKSLEVIQAFVFLAHWAQPEKTWAEDRSWAWQGEALRIATEIRLDLLIDFSSLRYKTSSPLTEADLPRFQLNRSRSWSLLFAGEIAMCIQTGRMEAIVGLSLPGGLKASAPDCGPDDPAYNYYANETANRIFARALNLWAGLREEVDSPDMRKAFMSFWKPALDEWWKRWSSVNPFIDIFCENLGIILNLISLRLQGGPPQAILSDCRAAALRTLQKVSSWEDRVTQIGYASNFVVVNIAYGAVLLLQLSYFFERKAPPELESRCLNVANVLDRIGAQRPNGVSIASIHASRVRHLINVLRHEHEDPSINPHVVTEPVPDIPTLDQTEISDYSFLTSGESLENWASWDLGWPNSFSTAALDFLDSTSADPMLGFLWGDSNIP
ncbi:hypothetical protein T439DRAFT_328888 [Meredithblackwellia eburnea MCA 4105]